MNLKRLLKEFKGEIKFKEPLSRHTTFKIGGKVEIWARPLDYHSLRLLIEFAKLKAMPLLILGCGSNLLVKDSQLKAIAVNLGSANFSRVRLDSQGVIAGVGIKTSRLIQCCLKAQRGGLEFLAGIPATLGGAIHNNASSLSGSKVKSMADILQELKVMTRDAKIRTLKGKDIKFGYRNAGLSQYIILEARLRLKHQSQRRIRQLLNENLMRRRKSQESSVACAGCIFRNPSKKASRGLTAGYLIEGAGLKGRRIGDAEVSRQHANFIINKGQAKASDVIKLINLIKSKVKKRFKVELEPEIEIIGRKKFHSPFKIPRFL